MNNKGGFEIKLKVDTTCSLDSDTSTETGGCSESDITLRSYFVCRDHRLHRVCSYRLFQPNSFTEEKLQAPKTVDIVSLTDGVLMHLYNLLHFFSLKGNFRCFID